MSVFIQLTALKRNDLDFASEILVDVNKIVNPVIENVSNNSLIEVEADNSYSDDNFRNNEKYEVDQDLVAIDALTDEVFIGTVVTEDGRSPISTTQLFVRSKIVGTIREVTAGGNSVFDYKQMSMKSPVTFVVTENLAAINI